jgi:SAM-dependent methyltransferase
MTEDALRPSAGAALEAWAARVRANRDQVERVRESPERADFYAPIAAAFKADPHRTDEPALDVLRSLVRSGETWLDIGAGGGRYALPIALLAREVVALDPSDGMLAVLRETMAETGIANVRPVQSRWPAAQLLAADVCLISHVGYDIEEIGPFLDAMEASAKRLCVAVLLAEAPATPAAAFWPDVVGESRQLLPALPEFLALQLARGQLCEVRLLERAPVSYGSRDAMFAWLRQQLFVDEGSERDRRLLALVQERVVERDGRFSMPGGRPVPLGVVTWAPR